MLRILKSLYLNPRFLYGIFAIALGFFVAFWIPILYSFLWVCAVFLFLFFIWDTIALFRKDNLIAKRTLPTRFSNSDENLVQISLENVSPFKLDVEVIDELPVQFQKRDFSYRLTIPPFSTGSFNYHVRPVIRGEYHFGSLNIYASTQWRLSRRRYRFDQNQEVKVYPSFIQMKKYNFLAIDNRRKAVGFKKIRRIGHTMEFEQIKEYVPGDDIRTLNWKATAKRGDLMVNQYQDEQAQPLYSLIDRSRVMKLPFQHLSLLDYAINATLAFSNIALKRKDKVGMFSFSNSIDNSVKADTKITQLNIIQESLYNIGTGYYEADYGRLYGYVKRQIPQRSLMMLYTNFEHKEALRRQLPYLMGIARKHLLVVILFENTELRTLAHAEAGNIREIFEQTIAQEFVYEKEWMKIELERHGIKCILTQPEDLTPNVINKYLELKAMGML